MEIDNNQSYEYCPLCKSTKIYKTGVFTYASPRYFSSHNISLTCQPELWRCKNCNSGSIHNIIPKKIAFDLYASGFSGDRWNTKSFTVTKTKEVIILLEKLLKHNLQVLDIGCNTGELLDFAKSKGCITTGVEFSESSLKIIKEKGHYAFHTLDQTNQIYDIVTAFDLVEHLYDLPEFLRCCHKKIADEGYLILLTGDICSISAYLTGTNWWYVQYPEHIIFPSIKFFRYFSNGFRLEQWYSTFASEGYRVPIINRIRGIVSRLLRKMYVGLPAITADHVIIVLRKMGR